MSSIGYIFFRVWYIFCVRGSLMLMTAQASTETADLIKAWREWTGVTQSRLAQRSGITQGLISRYELGKSYPTTYQLDKLVSDGFGITLLEFFSGPPGQRVAEYSVEYVETDEPRELRTVTLPVFDSVPAGGFGEEPVSDETVDVLRHLVEHEHMVVVRVTGASMYPRILPDDLVLVDTSRRKARSGEIVIARYRNEVTLKRYRIINRQPVLVADNPEFSPMEIENHDDFSVIGVVVRIIDRDLNSPL